MPQDNTLLSILSGGRFRTSEDLPELKESAHGIIDNLISSHGEDMSQVVVPSGRNIFGQETAPVTKRELLEMVTGIGGTTRPVMKMLGLTKNMPRNPLYHITGTHSASKILKEGIQPFGGKISMTRDPKLKEVFGLGKKDVQILLDKDVVSGIKGSTLSPTAYRGTVGGAFGKGKKLFEAEEALTGENVIPINAIKAIKIRNLTLNPLSGQGRLSSRINKAVNDQRIESLKELLASASKQNIPVIVNKKASSTVSDILGGFPSTRGNVHFIGKAKNKLKGN